MPKAKRVGPKQAELRKDEAKPVQLWSKTRGGRPGCMELLMRDGLPMKQASKKDGVSSGRLQLKANMLGPRRDVLRAGSKGSKQVRSRANIEGPNLAPPKTGVENPGVTQLRIDGNGPKFRGSGIGIGGSDRPKPIGDVVKPHIAIDRAGKGLSKRRESRTGGLEPKRVWPKMLKLEATCKRLLTGGAGPGRARSRANRGAPEQAMP